MKLQLKKIKTDKTMTNKKPELLAPAGSFMCAYYAFKAGADAVYLGLPRYSARMTAQNFNNNELLKLKKIACDEAKKIYVAVNTVICENELDDLIRNLRFMAKLEVDGIIVQDFGIIELIRNYFPAIPIHASTQTAIHNEQGIEKGIELGIKRIILPRELQFKKIKEFRKKYKEMEFEVFIHGSLCYSYSGLCLSSGLLAGRSGNRGECTQLCRNLYSFENESGNYLSCRDLFLGDLVRKLADIKVDSFKIEGRQKSPEYIYNVVKLYRYIIDENCKLKGRHYEELLNNSGFVFSREKTKGYIFGKRFRGIITKKYARNIGSVIGKVKERHKDSFSFVTKSDLVINDVLLFFLNKSEKVPYKIPLRRMEINNRNVLSAERDSLVKIFCGKAPVKGQKVFKAYSKGLELPGITHRNFPAYRKKLFCGISFLKKKNFLLRIDFIIDGKNYSIEFPLIAGKSGKQIDLKERLQKSFSRPFESFYEIIISHIGNESSINMNDIFMSGTMLTGITRLAYQNLEKIDKETDERKASLLLKSREENKKTAGENLQIINDPGFIKFIEKRNNINLKNNKITFYTGNFRDLDLIASFGKYRFIPLKPVVYENKYYSVLKNFFKDNPDEYFFLGINNIHHLKFMESLKSHENVYSFIDFFFYAANSFTLENSSINKAKVLFAYFWIEGNDKNYEYLKKRTLMPLFKIESSFSAPVFLHDGSFAKESLDNKKVNKLSGDHISISDKDIVYDVYEDKDFTYIFKG